jgi:hypothetical protein
VADAGDPVERQRATATAANVSARKSSCEVSAELRKNVDLEQKTMLRGKIPFNGFFLHRLREGVFLYINTSVATSDRIFDHLLRRSYLIIARIVLPQLITSGRTTARNTSFLESYQSKNVFDFQSRS